MSSAGRIRIDVSEPYPCWCRVYVDDELQFQISHTEIADLIYAAQRAAHEAEMSLKATDDEDEVFHGCV